MHVWRCALACALASACAPVTLHSKTAPHVDLSRYVRYTWSPNAPPPNDAVEHALRSALAHAGMVDAGPTHADVYVGYRLTACHGLKVTDYGNGQYTWAHEVVTSYREGVLMLELIDVASGELVWWGAATGPLADLSEDDLPTVERVTTRLAERLFRDSRRRR